MATEPLSSRLGLHRAAFVVLIVLLTAPLLVQGITVLTALDTARTAEDAAADAKRTANIADAATNPNCDPDANPECRRLQQQRQGQAAVVPDLNEVSTIAAYCGNEAGNDTLPEVRDCVEREFRARTGYPPPGGGTAPRTTVTTGG